MSFEFLHSDAENALQKILDVYATPDDKVRMLSCEICKCWTGKLCKRQMSNPDICVSQRRILDYLCISTHLVRLGKEYTTRDFSVSPLGWAYFHIREQESLKARQELEKHQKAEADRNAEKKADYHLAWVQFWLNAIIGIVGIVVGAFLATNTTILGWFTNLF